MGKFKNFIFKTLVGGGLSLILLSLLNSLNVYTADAVTTYTEGGVTYTYQGKNSEGTAIYRLVITGSGTVTDCWEDKLKNKDGVKYSTVIKQIQFNSATLTAVDSDAFDDCTVLNRVIISNYNNGNFNSTVFEGNTKITRLDLNDNITKVGNNAFKNCTNLATIELKNKLTTIGDYAFYKTKDTAITLPNTLTGIGSYAFAESGIANITIPANVGTIGSYAFYNCDDLKDVTIAAGVSTISNYAFADCGSLDDVVVNQVSNVNSYAFASSTIKKITFKNVSSAMSYDILNGSTVTTLQIDAAYSMNDNALRNCNCTNLVLTRTNSSNIKSYGLNSDSLTKVTITCGSIASNAFKDYTNITEVTLTCTTTIGVSAFEGCTDITKATLDCYTISNNAFKNCTSLSNLTLSNMVSIGDYSFYKISETAITLPSTLTTIGKYAFYETKLTGLTIPASVIRVDEYAFYNCDNLADVTIKSGVDNIEAYAFANCTKLDDFTIENTATIKGNAFNGSKIKKLWFKVVGTLKEDACKDAEITTVDIDKATFLENNFLNSADVTNLYVTGCDILRKPGVDTSSLVKIDIRCKTIKADSFKNCSSLNNITLTNTEIIESYAFYDVADTDITLPNTLLTIGDYAFASSSLTKVTIPTNVTSLGNYAFSGCSSMTSVSFANYASNKSKLEIIGSNCFDGCNLSNFYVPFNIKTLGNDIFKSNSNLKAITLLCKEADSFGNNFGDAISVSSDGLNNTYTISKALSDNSIKDIRIWKTVIKIPNFAFTNNTRLEFVRVPAKVNSATPTSADAILTAKSNLSRSNTKVTSIGDFAFAGCSNLKVCYIPTQICEFGIESYNIHGSLTSGRQIGIGAAGIDLTVSHSVTPTADYTNSGVARVDVTTSFAGESTSELSEPQDYVFILDLTGSMNVAISYKLSDGTKEDGNKMKVSGRAFECLLDTLAEVSPDSRISVVGYWSSSCYSLVEWENYTDNKFECAYEIAEIMKKGYNTSSGDHFKEYETTARANGAWIRYCNKTETIQVKDKDGKLVNQSVGTNYRTAVLGALNYLIDKGWDYGKTNVLFMSDGGHGGQSLDSVKAFGRNLSAFAKTVYSVGLCVETETVDTTIDYSLFSLIKNDDGYVTGVKLSDNVTITTEDFPDCYIPVYDEEGNITDVTYVEVDLSQAYKTSKWLLAISPYAKYYNVAQGDSVYNDFKNIFMRFIASSTSYVSGLTLYDLYNEDVWEFVEDLSPSTVVYNESEGALSSVPTGKVYDEATDSFIANEGNGSFYFYVRLKDAYRTSNATYLVTDNAKGEAVVGINGKLANIVVEDTTPYYLDWAIHYNLLYNKGLTNN